MWSLRALADDELAAFEAHLAACDACQAEVESLEVARNLARDPRAVDALPVTAAGRARGPDHEVRRQASLPS